MNDYDEVKERCNLPDDLIANDRHCIVVLSLLY
jgi:hypothetical protein